MRGLTLIILCIACLPAVADEPQATGVLGKGVPGKGALKLDASNYSVWREHIRPSEDELAYQSLPWDVTFADGLQSAAEQSKPLFLWVMNGHPLGCT